jgi:hypothetical protein
VLALEAARAGSATGEATTVIRTLPSRTRRRLPLSVRRPAWPVLAALIVLAALVVGGVVLRDRAQRGTGTSGGGAGGGRVVQIPLRADAAHDYDPSGDGHEHPEDVAFAIDNNPTTFWRTETYSDGQLAKPGVGLSVDAAPGAIVRKLRIRTRTPGFAAAVYVASGALPDSIDAAGWKQVATVPDVASSQRVALDTAGQRSRYVLLWITSLPPDGDRVEISELAIYR